MKKLTNYALMFAVAATLLLSSCGGKGGDDDDEVKPNPAINWKTTSGYTFSNVSVGIDSTLKAGIIINHSSKIKNVKFEVTIPGGTFTLKDTNVSDKDVTMDFTRKVSSVPNSEVWKITATDEHGKVGTATFTVTVTGNDPDLLKHEPTPPQPGVKIYNVKDPTSNPSAFDLNTLNPESASGPDNLKDILDANTATGSASYIPKWTSKTGATFVKVTSSALTYANAAKYSQIVTYYDQNQSAAKSLTDVIATNDLYVVKAGDNGEYYLISIINVEDVAGTQTGDNIEFKYKSIR